MPCCRWNQLCRALNRRLWLSADFFLKQPCSGFSLRDIARLDIYRQSLRILAAVPWLCIWRPQRRHNAFRPPGSRLKLGIIVRENVRPHMQPAVNARWVIRPRE